MPWMLPAAIIGSSLLGGISSNKAASAQADAAKSAADAQLQASREANALQKQMYDEAVARQQPFLQGGTEDYNRLRALMSGGPQAAQNFLTMDPGYGFRLAEGQKALDRQLAAGGKMFGGGALKAGQQYAQGQASQEFGNAYNRLAGLAQIGPSAAGVMNNLGQGYANATGQNLMAGGQALGQGYLGAGAARASGYIGGANALTGGLSQYLNYNQNQALLNRFAPGGGPGGGEPGVISGLPAWAVMPGP